MTSEESQYQRDPRKWTPSYMIQAQNASQMHTQLFNEIMDSVIDPLNPGKYDVQFMDDEVVIVPRSPGDPPFLKVEDLNPKHTQILRRSAKEAALRKKYKIRDCCNTVRNTRGHLEECELYSGIPATEHITVHGDPESMSWKNSTAGRMFMNNPPMTQTIKEPKKMSTRQEVNKQLETMRQQLALLAEMQAKFNVLPEEDPYEDGQIVRFALRVKVRIKNPEYDGISVTKRLISADKDLTFVALRADGEWYVTGRSFFNEPFYSWEKLTDGILDSSGEFVKFEFLDGKGIWETVYPK